MTFQSFPDHAGVVSNASLGIQARMIAGIDCSFAHSQEIGQLLDGNQRAASAEIFRIESATAAGQVVLPAPQHLEALIEDDAVGWPATRYSAIQRWQGNVRNRKEHAEPRHIDVFAGFGER